MSQSRPVARREAIKYALMAVLFGTSASMAGASGLNASGDFVQKHPAGSQTVVGPANTTLSFFTADALTGHSFGLFNQPIYQQRVKSTEITTSEVAPFQIALEDLVPDIKIQPIGFFYGDGTNSYLALGNIADIDTQTKLQAGVAGQFQVKDNIGDEGAASPLSSAGAQVGLPTSSKGSFPNALCFGGHRHAFSGRFLGAQATLPLGQGAGLPFNFARVKINNNWTLRRIWVYAQAGPTGGTETYGIVNAAGVLQGTAVVLPAGAGVQQAESALQVTNLIGGTLYYVAQTAIGAGWAAGSVNAEVGFEYTMNV